MKTFKNLFVLCLFCLACSSVSDDVHRVALETEEGEVATDHVPFVAGDIPAEAFELLAESAADSCSICAREKRDKAFRILEQRFPPRTIVKSEGDDLFRLIRGEENELSLGRAISDDPVLTYRFHTTAGRLVGIISTDLTADSLAVPVLTADEGAAFSGAVEIIPFAYGDGPTFLHQPSKDRIVVMCRIVEKMEKRFWKPGDTN